MNANAKSQPLSENDADGLALAKPVRALSSYWQVIGGAVLAVSTLAVMGNNVSHNTTSIEQIKTERGAAQRVDEEWRLRFDERLRRIEESVASIAGQMRGK